MIESQGQKSLLVVDELTGINDILPRLRIIVGKENLGKKEKKSRRREEEKSRRVEE